MARSWAGARSGSSGGAPAIAERLAEMDHRDLRRDLGDLDPQQDRGRPRLGPHGRRHPGQRLPEHRQHVAVVTDEAELGVERDVLGQVPGGVVRFGAEHRLGPQTVLESDRPNPIR